MQSLCARYSLGEATLSPLLSCFLRFSSPPLVVGSNAGHLLSPFLRKVACACSLAKEALPRTAGLASKKVCTGFQPTVRKSFLALAFPLSLVLSDAVSASLSGRGSAVGRLAVLQPPLGGILSVHNFD